MTIVRMKTHFSGYYNETPWPDTGALFDVDATTAAGLVANGYAAYTEVPDANPNEVAAIDPGATAAADSDTATQPDTGAAPAATGPDKDTGHQLTDVRPATRRRGKRP